MNWLKRKILEIVLKKALKKVFTMKVKEWLSGKKTYLICIGTILGAVISWVSGEIELGKMIEIIVAAIIAITLRAGIAKGPKVEE